MPEENFELKDEIHEFLLPVIGFGALLGMAGGGSDAFESPVFSSPFAFGSVWDSLFLGDTLDSASKFKAPNRGGVSEDVCTMGG